MTRGGVRVPVDLAAGSVVGQGMLECCFPEQLETECTRCLHVLPGDFSGGIAVLLLDGMYEGFVLV